LDIEDQKMLNGEIKKYFDKNYHLSFICIVLCCPKIKKMQEYLCSVE